MNEKQEGQLYKEIVDLAHATEIIVNDVLKPNVPISIENHMEKTKDGCRGTLGLRASAISIKSEIKR